MKLVLLSASALFGVALAAQTSTIVSPNTTTLAEGDSNNAFPWNSGTVRRYQQIHSDVGGAARSITQISFRGNAGNTTNYTGTWACDLEMFMGDSVAWDQATFVFANNYVGTRSPVFARRVINLGPLGQNQAAGPLPFTVNIPLDAPHAYAGTQSLIWEAVVYSNVLTGNFNQIDAETGSTATGTTTITGTGCIATGRTVAMTHTFGASDRGGLLMLAPTVSNGPSTAPAFLAIGLSNPNLPIPGLCGSSFTDLTLVLDLGPTSATGAVTGDSGFALLLPNVGLAGATLFSQAIALDIGRTDPLPLSVSNGRSVVIPTPNLTDVVPVTRIYNNAGGTAATIAAAITSTHGYGIVTQFTY
jgi:hypothetical protein